MKREVLRNAGYIFERDDLTDGIGIRKSREFLKELTKTFANSCVAFHGAVGQLPFVEKERQVHSALLPALSKIADAVMVEHPVSRENGKQAENTHGWLDYWVLKEKQIFLIELKHAWFSVRTGKVRNDHHDTWTTATKQIASIGRSQLDNLSWADQRVIKIAMMIMPCFISSSAPENLKNFSGDDSKELLDSIIDGLDHPNNVKPNWSCLWSLHKNLRGPYQYSDRHELYPAVAIVSLVDNSLTN